VKFTLLVELCGRRGRVVTVDVDTGATVGQLVTVLAESLGVELSGPLAVTCTSTRSGVPRRVLTPGSPVEATGICDGDCLAVGLAEELADAPDPEPRTLDGDLEVAVVAGPGAGVSVPLPEVEPIMVGTGPECTIRLADCAPGVAVQIARHGSAVTINPEGHATLLFDGEPLPNAPAGWPPGALLEIGPARLSLRRTAVPERTGTGAGTAMWRRPPRVRVSPAPAVLSAPDVPPPAPRPSFPLATAIVPMAAGVVLWLATSSVIFLAFTAMGPLMALWRFIEDRKRGTATARRAERDFVRALLAFARLSAEAHANARSAARADSPDLADAAHRALAWRADLWERRSGSGDFAQVRLGTADLDSQLEFAVAAPPPGADEGLVAARQQLVAHHGIDVSVPVTVHLSRCVGVCGPVAVSDAVCRALVLQAATLHGPADIEVVVFAPPGRAPDWAWATWLPHACGLSCGAESDVAVATTAAAADALAGEVGALCAQRCAADRVDPATPVLLVVVDEDSDVGHDVLAPLLMAATRGEHTRVSVIWTARAPQRLPSCCRQVVDAAAPESATLVMAATGVRTGGIVVDRVDTDVCSAVARALAPLRDPEARERSRAIPLTVGLRDVLGEITADAVGAHWDGGSTAIVAPVGVSAGGVVAVDVVADGPHGLVVGTTGSGKSELLLTMIAALAFRVPPERLNFLLVDYKGGAAFDRLRHLPHVSGYVSDLEGDLAARVLVSLEGELRRRMHLLRRHGASDIDRMTAMNAQEAPPRLIIVVDEFAALARLVPAFVDGLVDVARRGRSLGVHLLIGTQQPDANTAKLADNTNLRIALAVQSDNVSREVIGVADAARLASARRGRALLRRGTEDIVEMQVAYGGTPHRAPDGTAARVTALDHRPVRTSPGTDDTDLDVLARAVEAAWVARGGGKVRPVWLPPLAAVVTIGPDAPAAGTVPLRLPAGVADEPQNQAQPTRVVDIEACRHVLVVGPQGSGRTSLCRTLASLMAASSDPGSVGFYGLDFGGGGLRCLAALAHCGGVVRAGEAERVDRLFAILEGLVTSRRAALSGAGCADLAELRAADRGPLPSVVVFLDGYTAFAAAHEDWTGGHVERLRHLIEDGPAAGVHFVVTADRVGSVPGRLAEGFGLHVALGGAGSEVVPGRGIDSDGTTWQVAAFGRDGSTAAQVAAIEHLATECAAAGHSRVLEPVQALPAEVCVIDIRDGAPEGGRLALGLDAEGLAPAEIDLESVPMFLVAGPMRSGRSTALATLLNAAREARPDAEAVLLAPRPSPLLDEVVWDESARGPEACAALAEGLADRVRERIARDLTCGVPLIVVVDDAELLAEGSAASALEVVARRCWDSGVTLLVAAEAHAAARAFGWLGLLRAGKFGLLLRPDPDTDGEIFRTRLPRRRGYAFPPGRGELVLGDVKRLVQVAR